MSINRLRRVLKQVKSESGQVLILVMLLLLVGGLILPPLLSLSMTGINAGRMYESKAHEVNSADSGLAHALWQIKYGDLASFLTSPSYDAYDFNTTWSYDLSEQLNTKDVNISVEHVWIPLDISTPNKVTARNIIESGKLIIFGSIPDTSTCKIDLVFRPEAGDELNIETMGIWLSPGFQYVADSSSFGTPTIQAHDGGQALLWDFDSTPFIDFPGVDTESSELRSTITFQYTASQTATIPATLSWLTTSGVSDVPYTWDADSMIYHTTSTAGSTQVESYNVKNELRKFGSAITGDYIAVGNSLLTATSNPDYRNRLYEESSATVDEDDIPASASIEAAYLYWAGWIDWAEYAETQAGPEQGAVVFSDSCSNFDNWDAGADWGISSGEFQGHHSGSESDRYLTMQSGLDLSAYSGDQITVSWNQGEDGRLESGDRLYFAFSDDGGSSWSSDIEAFRDDDPVSGFTHTVPGGYATDDFKMRFYLYGFGDRNEYCYLDNITVTVIEAGIFSDDCSSFNNWDAGSDWSISSGEFRGHHSGSQSDRYLTMQSSLDLSTYSGEELSIAWEQSEGGSLESSDRLYFAFSDDGGSSWSSDIEAFRGNDPPESFTYGIPSEYITANFKMRFYLFGFSSSSEYCYIDNIVIFEGSGDGLKYPLNPTPENLRVLVEETARVNTAMFNGVQVTADEWHTFESIDLPGEDTYERRWSYSSFYDATELIEQWIDDGDIENNGAGTYTLGHVVTSNEENPSYSIELYPSGETGYPLATPAVFPQPPTRHNYCYCGWSLILVYSSVDTEGHQIYLFDSQLIEGWHNDPDFDNDGNPGGSISGFIIPSDIIGDDEVAKLTVFCGEGDLGITGDRIKVNNVSLSNGASPVNNVWNSKSPGQTIDGIDIDTFTVDYPTLRPGDTSAEVNLPTDSDGFTIIYIILSFRSEITVSDAISYSIGYFSES